MLKTEHACHTVVSGVILNTVCVLFPSMFVQTVTNHRSHLRIQMESCFLISFAHGEGTNCRAEGETPAATASCEG